MKKSRIFSHDTTEQKCETVHTPPGIRTPNLLIKSQSQGFRCVTTKPFTVCGSTPHPDGFRCNSEKSRTFSHDMVAA